MKKLFALILALALTLPGLALADQVQGQGQGQTAVNYGGSPSSSSSATSGSSSNVANSGNSSLEFKPSSTVNSKSVGLPSSPIPGGPGLQSLFFRLSNNWNIQDLANLLEVKPYWTLEEAKALANDVSDLEFRVKTLRPAGWEVDQILVTISKPDRNILKRMYPMALINTRGTSHDVDSFQSFGLLLCKAIGTGSNVLVVQTQGASEEVNGSGWHVGLGGQTFHVGGDDVGVGGFGIGYGQNKIKMTAAPHHFAVGYYLPNDDPRFDEISKVLTGELIIVEKKATTPSPAAASEAGKASQVK